MQFIQRALLLLFIVCPPLWAQTSATVLTTAEQAAEQRARAAQMVKDSDQRYADEQAACYDKFLVNSCLEDAKKRHTQTTIEARELDASARSFEREMERADVEANEAERAAKLKTREAEQAVQAESYRADEAAKAAEREKKIADKAAKAEKGRQKAAADAAKRQAKLAKRAQKDAERAAKRAKEAAKAAN